MRKKMAAILSAAAILGTVGAAGAAGEEIELVIQGATYPIELNASGPAQELVKRLPLTVQFSDFGSKERIAYVKPALTLSGEADHGAPKVGAFGWYAPWGNLCVFREPLSYGSNDLFILGQLTPRTLDAIVKSADEPVVLRRRAVKK